MKKTHLFYATTALSALVAGASLAKEAAPKDAAHHATAKASSAKTDKMAPVEKAALPDAPKVMASEKAAVASQGMSLLKVLKDVYEANPTILAERQSLAVADEEVAQALAEWRPTVQGTYQRGRTRSEVGAAGRNYANTDSRQISISQPVFNGGGTIARTNAAKKRVMAQRSRLRTVEQDTMLQTVVAYADVVRDQLVFDLSTKNENVLKEQLTASQQRFDVGEVTKTDVAQSEARLARAKADLVKATSDLESSKAEFERLVGYAPKDVKDGYPVPTVENDLKKLIAKAMADNPALLESKYQMDAARHDVNGRKAALLPTVSVRGTVERQEGAGAGNSLDFNDQSVVMAVQVPLYQAGAEYSQIRQAKNTMERQSYTFRATEDRIQSAVTTVWEDYLASKATIEANKKAVESAKVALDGVTQEAQYGARTTLDVLDAEQELFDSEVNLARAQRDAAVSAYNLYALTGNLTPETLKLDTTSYDPKDHYFDVKHQLIGF